MDQSIEYYDIDLSDDTQPVLYWEMDEYLQHKRGLVWYIIVALGGITFSLLAYLVTSDELIAPIAILIMTFMVIIYSFKKPSRRKYALSDLGLKIGNRLHDYNSFRNFSLIRDNGVVALHIMNNKRFLTPLTIYLPADKGRQIIERLSQYIAYTPTDSQWTDRLMRYLRF